jgi:spore maturation protein CgeB
MKLLMIGHWQTDIFEEPLSVGFEKSGLEVIKFKWGVFFTSFSQRGGWHKRIARFQDKYMFGFLVNRINNQLLKTIDLHEPNIIFIYRGSHIYLRTIQKLKLLYPSIYIISYNNDDPFSKFYPWWKWRHFIKSIPYSHLHLAFRHSNIQSYYDYGAISADLFRGYFNPEVHKKIEIVSKNVNEFQCEVIFVGHYEDDGRAKMLDTLAGEDINVKIFGNTGPSRKFGWDDAIKTSRFLQKQKIRPVRGSDYAVAINSAKIGICFMSKLNNDTYTLRCFEIPACGTALFSEWSPDLDNLFEDGVNAVLFKSEQELVERVKYFLSHPAELQQLADNGYELVKSKGHDVYSRASWLVNKYSLLTEPGKINSKYTLLSS